MSTEPLNHKVYPGVDLGADAVAMGTRFASSAESPVHAETKRLIVSKEAEETIYSPNFDTWPCRVMKTPGGQRYTAQRLSPPVAISRSLKAARELNTPLHHLAREALQQGLVGAVKVAYFGASITDPNHKAANRKYWRHSNSGFCIR